VLAILSLEGGFIRISKIHTADEKRYDLQRPAMNKRLLKCVKKFALIAV
jgi:hypothetical protein